MTDPAGNPLLNVCLKEPNHAHSRPSGLPAAQPAVGPPPSPDLAADLNRIEREERIAQDRREQERLTQLRELTRFD